MGDRISIQFQNGNETSVVLFSHWGGHEFLREAVAYAKQLNEKIDTPALRGESLYAQHGPLYRGEPNTVMVDFIRSITKHMKAVEGNLYLGTNKNDGDNSDHGHHIITIGEGCTHE